MSAWTLRNWTGSLNRRVEREVARHLRTNSEARRARHSPAHRMLRGFLSFRTFGRFLAAYALLDLTMLVMERGLAWKVPGWPPSPPADKVASAESLITNIASYFVTAQVGVLGVVSIALGLVTLIAQRDAASTDVKIYYHEALAFEIVASCVALLAVLCVQLVWPLQAALHLVAGGSTPLAFKWTLLAVHLAWLVVNLAALAHFVGTTFGFVQQTARERFRRQYTVNVTLPEETRKRLRLAFHAMLGGEMTGQVQASQGAVSVSIVLGRDFGAPGAPEISAIFQPAVELHDIRTAWVAWVFAGWAKRCRKAAVKAGAGDSRTSAQLVFTPRFGLGLRGETVWCQRHGGVPLNGFERRILKSAFRFRRIKRA